MLSESSILKRSIILYMLIAIMFLSMVNSQFLLEQYAMYLSWKFANSRYQNYKEGVLFYDSLTRLDPSNAEAFAQLGVCLYHLGELGAAQNAYARAIVLNPKYKLD